MMLVFVDGVGFVMDYALSGPTLKYTMCLADAQQYELRSQATFAIKINHIAVDKASIVSYNTVTQ